ncbi:MAG: hypothetical protein ACI4TM_10665 [Candidatus Cryptobacteroides sp.]
MVNKQYESPRVQIIGLCTETAVLSMSNVVEKNQYYNLQWGGEDDEFAYADLKSMGF